MSHEARRASVPTAPKRRRADPSEPCTRPRDAATLVVHRGRGPDARVLMGRRPTRDRFMPDVYVFPGGRVDPTDALHPAASELRPQVADRLRARAAPARARALAVAAVRETWEETGLLLGEPDPVHGLRPALGNLEYLARAITPAGNPIRYHARFFLADAGSLQGTLRGNGELLDLAWLPIEQALELEIIEVTAVVLREAAARLAGTAPSGSPFVHYRAGARFVRRE